MAKTRVCLVIPFYNEEENILPLYKELRNAVGRLPYEFAFIFVDDGSSDDSSLKLEKIRTKDPRVTVLSLVRNFGKEIAVTAGLNHCKGDAAILMDADLQHPPELIAKFLAKWEEGAEVVVGIRDGKRSFESWRKRASARLFYRLMNSISETAVTPNATDYRLLDRVVIDEFNRFTERNRLTRGLIDWLGFRRDYVFFRTPRRRFGDAKYSTLKLVNLALHSFVSLSLIPLQVTGYLGVIITLVSGALGMFILIEKYTLHDPWSLSITGTATLGVVLLFLIGIVLMALGLIALYIANIHGEVVNRPLYVIRNERSKSRKKS